MLAKQADTNGYRWMQNSVHRGNYIVTASNTVTCLILPEVRKSVGLSQGKSKNVEHEKNKV